MKICIVGILLIASTCALAADQDPMKEIHGALVSAKISGGCTILIQMDEFQKSTKMPGGDEFLQRFLSMESARLGVSIDRYVQMCADAGRVYEHYYQLTSEAHEQE